MLLLAGKALFAALNSVGMLRVSKERELRGLDLDQHGISAYPQAELIPSK
jgi:ammonia channel protein AmtB